MSWFGPGAFSSRSSSVVNAGLLVSKFTLELYITFSALFALAKVWGQNFNMRR
jgi:hypothetical protein